MITQEIKEKNLRLFLKKLSSLNIPTEALESEYKEKLLNATFTPSNDYGNAYDGSLLEIVLKKLTPYAIKINDSLDESIQVDKNTLIKICLLHHIAKSVSLIPNDNAWEVEKRGLLYKYNNDIPSIRTGLHSLIIAQNCGISFTAEEAEAMTINDRTTTDEQAKWHSSVLSTIVRQANELTYLDINKIK